LIGSILFAVSKWTNIKEKNDSINAEFLLPEGEGQDEGDLNQAVGLILSPHPNPLPARGTEVPEGEGVEVQGTSDLFTLPFKGRVGEGMGF
jgi:hypothetical protein